VSVVAGAGTAGGRAALTAGVGAVSGGALELTSGQGGAVGGAARLASGAGVAGVSGKVVSLDSPAGSGPAQLVPTGAKVVDISAGSAPPRQLPVAFCL
jgi:hypothetical protein